MRSFQILSLAALIATSAIFTAEAHLRSSFVEDSVVRRLSTYGGTEDEGDYGKGGKGGMLSTLLMVGAFDAQFATTTTIDFSSIRPVSLEPFFRR
jgi:hypothetical protein